MRQVSIVTLLVLAGCGGHGDQTGPILHAPFIQNLVITPLTPLIQGRQGVYEFRADFADPDGDLDGGTCEINSTIGPAQLPLVFAGGSNPAATFGTVVCDFQTTVLGRVVFGQFTITDRNGLTSNAIDFTVPAERKSRR